MPMYKHITPILQTNICKLFKKAFVKFIKSFGKGSGQGQDPGLLGYGFKIRTVPIISAHQRSNGD
jgi:hypothetical protein